MKFNIVRCLLLAAAALPSLAFAATQIDIIGPTGSDDFGTNITLLPNGNFVVTDPTYDQPSPAVANVGAVYLYSPDGVLISKLTGGTANNQVGSNGCLVLKNGNFVVKSPLWDNGAATDAGAVTWGSMTTGFGAAAVVVSAANSLVGSTLNDGVGGSTVAPLPNGNYVVLTPSWNIPAGVADVGAATFCNGSTGTSGAISAANSLVGSTVGDQVGFYGASPAGSSHYVVRSPFWNIPAGAADVGAITWCNGTSGIPFGAGSPGIAVSGSNSLIGSTANDQIGAPGVVAVSGGNYVVVSPNWDVPAGAVDVGAVTWVNGNTGAGGVLSSSNSLIGGSANDQVGAFGITVLSNGHYVVGSPQWSIPAGAVNVGAVTWCNGGTGRAGLVTTANSLVGSSANDSAGGYGIFALTNGNYVVVSGDWDIPSGAADVGAVTWCNGSTGATGAVTAANSLIGSTLEDRIGQGGVALLTNGNYVVQSPFWDNPSAIVDVGAATWGNGATGIKGTVSSANSLIGGTVADQVSSYGVYALTNGNYVVASGEWSVPSGAFSVGAATWGNGASGIKGVVSAGNSLIGKTAFDMVGSGGVRALTNGNYVVTSEDWDNPSPLIADVGAVTFGKGASGVKGVVSAANSLIGSSANDIIGSNGVQALTNGNYFIRSPKWNNGAIVDAGAVTWASGTSGIKGTISASNSLVGSNTSDEVGRHSHTAMDDGNYVSKSLIVDNTTPPTTDSGAVILCDGSVGTSGPLSLSHAVFGTTASGGLVMDYEYDNARAQLIVGRPADNKVTLLGNRFRSLAKTNLAAPGALDIAYSTVGSAAVNNVGAVTCDYTLTGAGTASGKNRAIFGNLTASDAVDLVLQTGTNVSAFGTGLPNNTKLLTVLSPLNQQASRALFQATVSGTGIASSSNRLLLKDDGFTVSVLRRTGQPIGIGALSVATAKSFSEVLQSHDQDLIAINYVLATNTVTPVTTSSDSGIVLINHNGTVSSNLAAREGSPAFGGGGTFGQFTGHTAAGLGSTIHFAASFKPTVGSAVNALFRMSADGLTTAASAKVGDLLAIPFVTGDGAVKFASLPAFTQQGTQPLFKATLSGCTSGTNEGLFHSSSVKLIRKGDDVDATNLPGIKFGSISRFWPIGSDQLIVQCTLTGTGVTASSNQAIILRQADGVFYVLLRTGSTPPGIDAAKVLAFSAVDVNPVSGRYAILATLTSAPATSNQALWTGNTGLGADTPASSQALRLPIMRLRKGDRYTTSATPLGVIKSLTLKPAVDATGAGGRGLAQCIGSGGDTAVYILGDRSLTELVMLPP